MQKFNGLEYIAIDIANNVGLDKSIWEERIQWVKDNRGYLEALMPESNKHKYLYMKAVQAFRDAEAGIPTGFIMGEDASNSGVQVISLLLNDIESATTCNLINTGKVEDVYTNILLDIN